MKSKKVFVSQSTSSRILLQSRLRLLCVGLFFILCYGSITVRLVEIVIGDPPRAMNARTVETSDDEEDFEVKTTEKPLQRGDIVDRNGVLLATSLVTASAFANPRELTNVDEAAAQLATTLGMNKDVLMKRLGSDKSFVWIKRRLTPVEQQRVNSLGIPGVYFMPEEQRIYPYGSVMSHVVGYVGVDNKGLAGIEKTFDQSLTDEDKNAEPLALSIDVRLQHIIRDEMRKAMDEFRAIGAVGVIMDVQSGELVAMSSLPDFDPNKPARATDAQKFNRATLGAYEMGSTFKTFTTAMVLDSGKAKLSSLYDATNPLKIGAATISDTHPKKRWLSVPEVYAYSSNIGTARMAMQVGLSKQQAFLQKLGMMKPVDIELPERSTPLVPKEWKEINGVTISYGHGISVSPLHLVRGVAAMVNGGVLKSLTLLKGGENQKAAGESVIDEKTSYLMRRLMRLVVKHGTGGKADIAGYRVGGKTGTAEKINAAGSYSEDAKIASFVATFPMEQPKYVILVMVDEPKGNKSTFGYATGGWVAAPVVGRVISRMAPVLGLPPTQDDGVDDAEKYWVETGKKPAQTVSKTTASAPPKRFIHDASYSPAR